uniref:Mitochondrial import receptor subunit TOM20 homolog n=1 Tax=Balaenoptera musculus TaxID=9771 RepID=A0A8C0DWU8_BALMU
SAPRVLRQRLVCGLRRRRPHSSLERRWWAGTAPSPPACAGPFSSGTAFTSTARDGVTPTSRTGCGNVSGSPGPDASPPDPGVPIPSCSSPGRRVLADRVVLPGLGRRANKPEKGRKKQKLAKERAGLSKLPDLKDAEAVQKFFLEEIQLGEELLAQGEYEKGVDHLTNAIAVCGQPQQLLQVLQQTLPPPVFQMLLTKLPTISQRIVSAQSLAEDDVE